MQTHLFHIQIFFNLMNDDEDDNKDNDDNEDDDDDNDEYVDDVFIAHHSMSK